MWKRCCKSIAVTALALSLFLGGCGFRQVKRPISDSTVLLNTHVSITLYDERQAHLIDECFDLIAQYEKQLSRTIKSSEIAKLNARTIDTVSDDTASLLQKALYFSEISDGAFDVTVGAVTPLWDFTAAKPTVPSESAISEAVTHVGYRNVVVDGNTVSFSDPAAALDLGAIAKGYIADRVKAYLTQNGVEHGIINLGGNLLCIGDKTDGKAYTVGVQKPGGRHGEYLLTVEVTDKSVVTSGIYERFFEANGRQYHHILDPKTGYPIDNELAAVTIISERSVDGDGYSTTCMALGLEKSKQLINRTDGIDAIWITRDGTIHYSDGLTDRYTISE